MRQVSSFRFLPALLACAIVIITTTAPSKASPGNSNTTLPTPTVKLTEEERAWLREHPVIRIGNMSNLPPVIMRNDDGSASGISIDYLKLVASMMGVELEFVTASNWSLGLEKFKNHNLDIIPMMMKTEERKKYTNFTEPYLSKPYVIFTHRNSAYIGSMKKLAGRKVAVPQHTVTHDILKNNHPEIELVVTPTSKDALYAVADGRADAHLSTLLITGQIIRQEGLDIKAAGHTPYKLELGMGVRKDWTLFTGILQKALNAIPQDERELIQSKWIGVQIEEEIIPTYIWWVIVSIVSLLIAAITVIVIIRRQLELKNKFSALQSRFISLVSHEFRTPLAIIDSTAQRLVRSKTEITPELLHEKSDRIRKAVERMTDLIENTLYAARLEEGAVKLQLAPLNPARMLREIGELHSEVSPDHDIAMHIDTLPRSIVADKKMITIVLNNLLSNAIKFAPNAPVIEVKGWAEDEHAVISVTDHGIGISKDDLPHMFSRFFRAQTAEGIKGTGIGLNVCKEFVEMHGGSIDVDSVEGKGSAFTVRLPICGVGP